MNPEMMKEIKKSILLDLAKSMKKQVLENEGSGMEEMSKEYCPECGSKMKEGMCPECGEGEDIGEDDEAPEFPMPKKEPKVVSIDIISALKKPSSAAMPMMKKGRK